MQCGNSRWGVEQSSGKRHPGCSDRVKQSRDCGRTIHPYQEVEETDMLIGHPEGYRIRRGGRKSSAGGRSPFLSRSLQLFTTVAPLEYSFPTSVSSLGPSRFRAEPAQVRTGNFREPWGWVKGRGGISAQSVVEVILSKRVTSQWSWFGQLP